MSAKNNYNILKSKSTIQYKQILDDPKKMSLETWNFKLWMKLYKKNEVEL